MASAKKCRACLESADKMYPLVGPIVNVDVDVATMLSYCISGEIDPDENLPDSICLTCFKILRIAYNFLVQFRESQEKLLDELEASKDITYNKSIEHIEISNSCDGGCSENSIELVDEIEPPSDVDETEDYNLDTNEVEYVRYDVDMIHNYANKSGAIVNGTNVPKEEDLSSGEPEISNENTSNNFECKLEMNVDEKPDLLTRKDADGNSDSQLCDALKAILPDPSDSNIGNFIIVNEQADGESERNPTPDVTSIEDEPRGKSAYVCPLCKLKFGRFAKFEDHISAHNQEIILCNKCPTPTKFNSAQYIGHYKAKHRYHCNICNKSLMSSYGYRYHLKQHQNSKSYKCPVEKCAKSFFLHHLLKNHMRTHSNKTLYTCNLCMATFKTYDTFRYHQKTHGGRRSHVCTHCGKAFFQAVHLRDHVYRHMGLKRFNCDNCDYSFVTNSQLKKHTSHCKHLKTKVE